MIWKFAERIAFLAWLDFCVQNSVEPANEIFCKPVEETTGTRFSIQQIENRFRTVANNERTRSPYKLCETDLRLKGTRCLSHLSTEEQELIKEMTTKLGAVYPEFVKEIHAEYAHENSIVDHTMELSYTRQWVRENLQQPNGKEDDRKRKSNGEEEGNKSNDHPAKRTRSQEVVGPPDTGKIGIGDRNKRRTRISFENQEFNPSQVQPSSQQGSLNMTSPAPTAVSNGSQRAPTAPIISTSAAPAPAKQSSLTKLTLREKTPLERRLLSEIKQKNLEIRDIRHQWNQEAWKAFEREENHKLNAQKLRRENTHLVIARDERRQAGKNPLEDILYLKNEEIWKLSKRVKDMEKLAPFTRCDEVQPMLSWTEVTSAMDMLSSELEIILPGHDQRKPLLVPDIVAGFELARLIRCILGSELDVAKEKSTLRCWVSKFDPEVVLRSLIMAAVKEWVFMSEFPTLDPDESPVLRAYREIVQAFGKSHDHHPEYQILIAPDGWASLRNLDLAAHHKLVNSDNFRKSVISKKADELACRLSRTLAPLFIPPDAEPPNGAFGSWGEGKDATKNRRYKLQSIFEAVLSLKTKTLLSNNRYEFKVHEPGTHTSIDQQDSGFWLLATIYMHSNDGPSSGNEMLDALVNSKTFFGQVPLGNEPKQSSRLLIQKRDLPRRKFDKSQLDKQISSEQSQPRPTCPKCRKDFAQLADLQSHQENRLCGKCGRCNRLFKDLKIHALEEHGEVVKLPINASFGSPIATAKSKTLKAGHSNTLKNYEQSDEFEGSESSEVFDDSDQSYSKRPRPKNKQTRRSGVAPENPATPNFVPPVIMRGGIGDNSLKLTCSLCLRQFSRHWNLKEHQRKGSCSSTSECPHCEQSINGSAALREHILQRHSHILNENVRSLLHISDATQEQPVQTDDQAEKSPGDLVVKEVEVQIPSDTNNRSRRSSGTGKRNCISESTMEDENVL